MNEDDGQERPAPVSAEVLTNLIWEMCEGTISESEAAQLVIAAGGAVCRHWPLRVAVMAAQQIARPMVGHPGIATFAAGQPTAAMTDQHRGVATPVQEQQHLLVTFQPLADGIEQRA